MIRIRARVMRGPSTSSTPRRRSARTLLGALWAGFASATVPDPASPPPNAPALSAPAVSTAALTPGVRDRKLVCEHDKPFRIRLTELEKPQSTEHAP